MIYPKPKKLLILLDAPYPTQFNSLEDFLAKHPNIRKHIENNELQNDIGIAYLTKKPLSQDEIEKLSTKEITQLVNDGLLKAFETYYEENQLGKPILDYINSSQNFDKLETIIKNNFPDIPDLSRIATIQTNITNTISKIMKNILSSEDEPDFQEIKTKLSEEINIKDNKIKDEVIEKALQYLSEPTDEDNFSEWKQQLSNHIGTIINKLHTPSMRETLKSEIIKTLNSKTSAAKKQQKLKNIIKEKYIQTMQPALFLITGKLGLKYYISTKKNIEKEPYRYQIINSKRNCEVAVLDINASDEELAKDFASFRNYIKSDIKVSPIRLKERNEILEYFKYLEKAGSFTFDIETVGLDGKAPNAKVVSIGFYTSKGTRPPVVLLYRDIKKVFPELKALLEGPVKKKGQNLMYDIAYLYANLGIKVRNTVYDTSYAEYLIQGAIRRPRNLGALAWKYTQYGGYKSMVDKYIENMDECPEDLLIKYNGADVFVGEHIEQKQKHHLTPKQKNLLKNLIMPVAEALSFMKVDGVPIHKPTLDKYMKEFKKILIETENEWKTLTKNIPIVETTINEKIEALLKDLEKETNAKKKENIQEKINKLKDSLKEQTEPNIQSTEHLKALFVDILKITPLEYTKKTHRPKLNSEYFTNIVENLGSEEDRITYITLKKKEIRSALINKLKSEIETFDKVLSGEKIPHLQWLNKQKAYNFKKEYVKILKKVQSVSTLKQFKQVLNELSNSKFKRIKGYAQTAQEQIKNLPTLKQLKTAYEIGRVVVKHKHFAKVFSTYLTNIAENLYPTSNPDIYTIHCDTTLDYTATGRTNSGKPLNLQNFPSRIVEAIDKKIDKYQYPFNPYKVVKAIVCSRFPNGKIINADYSQMEYRIMASLANETDVIKRYCEDPNADFHTQTARMVFKIENPEKKHRDKAKCINFGLIYGITPHGVARNAKIPVEEAEKLMEEYFKALKNTKEFMEKMKIEARKNANPIPYLESAFGRRRYFPNLLLEPTKEELNSKDYYTRKDAERRLRIVRKAENEACNFPVQSTAADFTLISIKHIAKAFERLNLKSKIIITVHDSIVVDTHPKETELVTALMKHIMENIGRNYSFVKTPLRADIAIGDNYKDTEDIDPEIINKWQEKYKKYLPNVIKKTLKKQPEMSKINT